MASLRCGLRREGEDRSNLRDGQADGGDGGGVLGGREGYRAFSGGYDAFITVIYGGLCGYKETDIHSLLILWI